jgi:FKBP-type peptidyl-prolyl cis-trans isomerase
MKKIICLVLLLGLVVMFGCAQEKPEAAARKIFEQQVAGHQGLELDTSGLVYKIVEQGEDNVLVQISGDMAVKASLPLVKKGGQWVLAIPADEAPKKEAATH